MKSDNVVSFLRNVTVSCAKCSTAIRICWAIASPQPEADAGLGVPARDRDRRAVGAPAGGAREHAVLAEPDRIHAAGDGPHFDDLMPHRPQPGAHAFRDRLLDLERVAFG